MGSLMDEVKESKKDLSKVEEVSIDTFIEEILPTTTQMEVMFEGKHQSRLMQLIAPQDAVEPILKWNNNFTWTYNGGVADSMKERVKSAGGSVTGVLRFSIQWNEDSKNNIDFDAHCIEPDGNLIYYSNSGRTHPSSGILDVDIINPGGKIAVENITWSNVNKMQQGTYKFIVHNFSGSLSKGGFTAEIEYGGEVYTFAYNQNLRGGEKIEVAIADFTKADGLKIKKSLPSEQLSTDVWDISTEKFHKVNILTISPNHWDGQEIGNKHYFFILDQCRNPEQARGFYNEFLKGSLDKHRKVFEVLAGKTMCEVQDEQLSGLGFSSTQHDSVVVRLKGKNFNRMVKIKF